MAFPGATSPTLRHLLKSQLVLLGEAYHLPDLDNPEQVEENELDVAWFQQVVGPLHNASEPVLDIFYPILDAVDSIAIDDPLAETMVGAYAVSIFPRRLMENILPSIARGIVVVLDNPCNPTFTYQIDGPEVTYLGPGDFHETKYDDLIISANLGDLVATDSAESIYSGLPIDREYCPWASDFIPIMSKRMTLYRTIPSCSRLLWRDYKFGIFVLRWVGGNAATSRHVSGHGLVRARGCTFSPGCPRSSLRRSQNQERAKGKGKET